MSRYTHTDKETDRHTDLVPEVAPPEVGHLKIPESLLPCITEDKGTIIASLVNPSSSIYDVLLDKSDINNFSDWSDTW